MCNKLLKYVTLDHKASLKSLGYICSNSKKYTVWIKFIYFPFMPKIIRTLSRRPCSMKIFSKCPTVNVYKHIFLLVICIAKNFIWTTLKAIFSIFRFICTLRFQIFKLMYLSQIWSNPNIPYINGKLSSFQCINLNKKKSPLINYFVVQGHI